MDKEYILVKDFLLKNERLRLDERLKYRFKWGLILFILMEAVVTICCIVHYFHSRGTEMPEGVFLFLWVLMSAFVVILNCTSVVIEPLLSRKSISRGIEKGKFTYSTSVCTKVLDVEKGYFIETDSGKGYNTDTKFNVGDTVLAFKLYNYPERVYKFVECEE